MSDNRDRSKDMHPQAQLAAKATLADSCDMASVSVTLAWVDDPKADCWRTLAMSGRSGQFKMMWPSFCHRQQIVESNACFQLPLEACAASACLGSPQSFSAPNWWCSLLSNANVMSLVVRSVYSVSSVTVMLLYVNGKDARRTNNISLSWTADSMDFNQLVSL